MYSTSSLMSQDVSRIALLAEQIINPLDPRCLECSETIDSDHPHKHSIFLLARHEYEENG